MSSLVIDYDGLFYPPAVDEYLDSDEPSYGAVSSFYTHLNISGTEQEEKLKDILSSRAYDILRVARYEDESSRYEIAKYFLD